MKQQCRLLISSSIPIQYLYIQYLHVKRNILAKNMNFGMVHFIKIPNLLSFIFYYLPADDSFYTAVYLVFLTNEGQPQSTVI